jgi:Holliday junction DNA helicase RuvB
MGQSVEIAHRTKQPLLADLVGQERAKAGLRQLIAAARQRKAPLDHILLLGPYGVGKVALAQATARECGARLTTPPGDALKNSRRFFLLVCNMHDGELLLLERFEHLPGGIREIAAGCIERRPVETVVGRGQSAQRFKVLLPHITVIASAEKLTTQLKALYEGSFVFELEPYDTGEIQEIVLQEALQAGARLNTTAAQLIAEYSEHMPGEAVSILKRVQRLVEPPAAGGEIGAAAVQKALVVLGYSRSQSKEQ